MKKSSFYPLKAPSKLDYQSNIRINHIKLHGSINTVSNFDLVINIPKAFDNLESFLMNSGFDKQKVGHYFLEFTNMLSQGVSYVDSIDNYDELLSKQNFISGGNKIVDIFRNEYTRKCYQYLDDESLKLSPTLAIGYGGQDEHLSYIFTHLNKKISENDRPPYLCLVNSSTGKSALANYTVDTKDSELLKYLDESLNLMSENIYSNMCFVDYLKELSKKEII